MNLADRFWSKVDRGAPDECWPWKASTFHHGYGQFKVHPDNRLAHRVAYELARGPIPDGLTIDHLCRNKLCQNPSHLEVVTIAENIRRRDVAFAEARAGKCGYGHELTTDNLTGRGACRECAARHKRTYRARHPEERARHAARERARRARKAAA